MPCSMVDHLLAGILISSLLITLKQNQVKVALAFADRAWKHLQLPWHRGLTVESELHAGLIGRIFDSGTGVFWSASSWIASTTPLSPANWTSLSCSYTTSIISSSTSAKRSVAWRNSLLHELLCVSPKVSCLTCALNCDWRRHPIANQLWLQMPALLAFSISFSISFVVNDTAELEVDPAPAPSLCLRKQCGCGWAVYRLAWRQLQRAQRAHEEHVVLSMNDFDEQPNKKEQDTSSSVTCRCLLAARAHDPWRKTDELFQISAT